MALPIIFPQILPQPKPGFDIPNFLPEADQGVIGATGHLIAAILQTAGLYGQSEVIQTFTPILHGIGALIYIWCICGGLFSVALFGNYKQAAYFLLGPALFWWALTTTVPASGTGWHFGERTMENNPETFMKLLKWKAFETDRAKEPKPRVSFFFAAYDNLLSNVVQGLVAVLIDTKHKQDLLYVARERMLTQLFRAEGTEEGFIALLAKGLMGHCGELALVSHQLTLNYNTEDSQKLKQLREARNTELYGKHLTLELDMKRYIHGVLLYHDQKDEVHFSPEDSEYFIPNEQYLKKDDPLLDGPIEQDISVTCQDIWRYGTLAAWMAAEQYMTSDTERKKYPDIDWQEVRKEVGKAITYDDSKFNSPPAPEADPVVTSKATEVVAAYIIRNTLSNNIYGQVAGTIQSRSSWDPAMYRAIFGTVAVSEREVGRSKLEYFAGTIPYIQGMLLFLLSLAFPFFSVFLLMPGNIEKFAVWMGLWLWVKSWDVGFALMYFLRDLFWQYMQNDVRANHNIKEMNWDSPHLIYTVMLQNDPLSNLNTYFHIISLFTVAIPFLSAHLCLGATEAYDALKNSIDQQAIKFGKREGRAARRMYASMIGRQIAKYKQDYILAMAEWAKNNPGVNIDGEARSLKGDATHARFMDITKKFAEARTNFDQQQQMNKNYLAAVTGRKMAYDTWVAKGVAEAYVGLMNEKYQGPNMFMQSKGWPGLYDTKVSNDETGVDFPDVGKWTEEQYDEYGGGYAGATDTN